MQPSQILKELTKNKKDEEIILKIFGAPSPDEEIKEGLPLKELFKVIKKASKENLLPFSGDASYY